MKKITLTCVPLLMACICFAQDSLNTANSVSSEGLRAEKKIYVVVAVLLTILAGLIIYVARLDRKISKLEKQHN